MKRLLTPLTLLLAFPAFAQQLTPEEIKKLEATKPGQTILFDAGDSLNLRVAKATKCLPTKRQSLYTELEYTCFIHFGPNTFTGVEWGNGEEDPKVFNPKQVDADQWCRVAKEAGMKMMMITVKHHDGYCTWQTRYNDTFSVKASPWEDGKGDVLRLLSDACKKYGLKLGVYLSPADLYQIESKEGLYGNLSKYQDTIIPTDPASFQSNPMKGRKIPAGKPTFQYKVDDYNRYVLNQLYELLTEYGEIHEVWFDGAHPKRKGGQKYVREAWVELIRTLAPDACIAIKGPDVRWCGNEHGGTRQSEWSPVAIKGKYEDWAWTDARGGDLGSRQHLKGAGFVHWWVNEVDTSIRHGWFWRDEKQHVRSAEDVYDIYERTVGGNGVFLLNVPPNREGRFAERDVKALLGAGKRIRATYGKTAAGLKPGGEGVYQLDQSTVINRVMLMEPVKTQGQRVEEHAVDAWVDGAWKEVAKGTTIGYKKILRFSDVKTDKIRVRILQKRLEAKLSHVSVHHDLAPLKSPSLSRSQDGMVTIKGSGSLHYTLDGSQPTASSTVYKKPFALPEGGVVNVLAVRGEEKSEVVTARYDLSKAKWKIHHVSSQNPQSGEGADKAIDGDPSTLWHSKWSGGEDPHPHSLTIDFVEELDLKGFTYLPRKNSRGGVLDQYKVELSRDGKKWLIASDGRFDNIENDPTQREIRFKRVFPRVRYLRFTGVHSIENKPHSSAAEIGVITR
ncbi:alpha-L-fucosidase [Verrucomicrobiaceae bacterium N1E253]|uniref:alpha-L-fucosidase n=1 Tax=Oceaniferula marina TaxID=2748318 RepID=A0A851GG55_9BACT|nr:alpha-L-fucosidase [Oceaniferula marina]NWK56189.1 alpha-L-fucosidase [Oceaniferula marina]